MQNQEIIVLLIFHVLYSCLLPHFASMSDEYRAMTVYANNNCDDLSAQKKEISSITERYFQVMMYWIFMIYKQL